MPEKQLAILYPYLNPQGARVEKRGVDFKAVMYLIAMFGLIGGWVWWASGGPVARDTSKVIEIQSGDLTGSVMITPRPFDVTPIDTFNYGVSISSTPKPFSFTLTPTQRIDYDTIATIEPTSTRIMATRTLSPRPFVTSSVCVLCLSVYPTADPDYYHYGLIPLPTAVFNPPFPLDKAYPPLYQD